MTNQIKIPPILIKVGCESNLLKLQKDGQIYFGTFSGYRNQEKQEIEKIINHLADGTEIDRDEIDYYRRDPHEGRESTIDISIKKIKFLNEKLNHLTIRDRNGKFTFFQNKYEHLYSLYGLPSVLNTNFKIDSKMLKFGEHALIITNPKIFLEKIINELGENFDLGFIEYHAKEMEKYTIFQKKALFNYQNEFRITANIKNGNSIFIGNIEDISILVDAKSLLEIEYTLE